VFDHGHPGTPCGRGAQTHGYPRDGTRIGKASHRVISGKLGPHEVLTEDTTHLMSGLKIFHSTLMKLVGCTNTVPSGSSCT
jgi:hypothetical protein